MLAGRNLAFPMAVLVSSIGLGGFNLGAVAQEPDATQQPPSAQIREGLSLAAAFKAYVTETYLASGVVPEDRAALGMTPNPADTQGRYTASIDISQGEVVIAYGNAAHPDIAGKQLILTPFLTSDGSFAWQCGYSTAIADTDAVLIGANTGNSATTIDAQYLPTACQRRLR